MQYLVAWRTVCWNCCRTCLTHVLWRNQNILTLRFFCVVVCTGMANTAVAFCSHQHKLCPLCVLFRSVTLPGSFTRITLFNCEFNNRWHGMLCWEDMRGGPMSWQTTSKEKVRWKVCRGLLRARGWLSSIHVLAPVFKAPIVLCFLDPDLWPSSFSYNPCLGLRPPSLPHRRIMTHSPLPSKDHLHIPLRLVPEIVAPQILQSGTYGEMDLLKLQRWSQCWQQFCSQMIISNCVCWLGLDSCQTGCGVASHHYHSDGIMPQLYTQLADAIGNPPHLSISHSPCPFLSLSCLPCVIIYQTVYFWSFV